MTISKLRTLFSTRIFLIVFASLLTVSLAIGYVVLMAEEQPNRFLSLGILGKNMKTSDYFPDENPQIALNENLNWNVQVYNGMDTAELMSLRIKITNSTYLLPDDRLHSPSPGTQIFEVQRLLADNSTWTLPLEWSITKIDREGNSILIKEMRANGEDIRDLNVGGSNGSFLMVVELWKYDPATRDFVFEWDSGTDINEMKRIWTEIGFNIN